MNEANHKLWDIIIKALGFVAASASILIGISQFSDEQKAASELEFNRNFWRKQNELYAEVCRNAGTMAAAIDDPKVFIKEKQTFLSLYYGELVLVEDDNVEKAMRELKSFLDVFDHTDPDMVNKLKSKVIDLSQACKNSSATFKRAKLQ